MPRAVKPWTWRRALRDHGPKQQGLLLTLYTLGTFMDENGFAYPGQNRLARGARSSARTIRRHMEQAQALGWVGISLAGKSGQGWRNYLYRAAVPSHIQLTEKDEMLSDDLISKHGEIEREDPIVSAPSAANTATRGPAGVSGCPDVRTTEAERADTIVSGKVRTQLVPTKFSSEVLSDEGALSSTSHSQSMIPEARHRSPLSPPTVSIASPVTYAGAVGWTDCDLEAVTEEYGLLETRTLSERFGQIRAWEEFDATQPPSTDESAGGFTDQDLKSICEERDCEEEAREVLLQTYAEYEATNWSEAA